MYDRDRLTPVSLTVKRPVLHLVLNACLADTALLQFLKHTLDGILLICIAIQELGIDHLTVAGVCLLLDVATLDDLNDVDAEFLCEIIVSLVMCRNCHDRACTVAHHDIVCDEDWNLLAIDRIDCCQSVDADTGLLLDKLCTLKLGLLCADITVCLNLTKILNLILILINQRMLRRDNHKGNAIKGIRSGRVNAKLLIQSVYLEIHKCSCRLSDPVDLLLLDICRIIYSIQSLEQLVCILRNAQIPYVLGSLYDIAVTDVAFSALAVLVGKDDLTGWAVVYERLVPEYQTLLKHFQENPLRPLIKIRIRCIDHAAPVKGKSDAL